MLVQDLLRSVRHRLRDELGTSEQRLWEDAELIDDYANAARNKLFILCRRLVVDSTSHLDAANLPLCQLTVVANTASYALSPKILEIVRVKLASQSVPLSRVYADELDTYCYDWEGADAGPPWAYCPDLDTDKIRLIPTPDTNDTASLTVYRLPLSQLTCTAKSEALGIREEYGEDLIPWILHLAFLKKDAETDRPDLADYYAKKFLARIDEIKIETHRRLSGIHTNRPRGAFL